jgi:hypothetical protein
MTTLPGETSGVSGHLLHKQQQPANAKVANAKQIAKILVTTNLNRDWADESSQNWKSPTAGRFQPSWRIIAENPGRICIAHRPWKEADMVFQAALQPEKFIRARGPRGFRAKLRTLAQN